MCLFYFNSYVPKRNLKRWETVLCKNHGGVGQKCWKFFLWGRTWNPSEGKSEDPCKLWLHGEEFWNNLNALHLIVYACLYLWIWTIKFSSKTKKRLVTCVLFWKSWKRIIRLLTNQRTLPNFVVNFNIWNTAGASQKHLTCTAPSAVLCPDSTASPQQLLWDCHHPKLDSSDGIAPVK